MKKVTLDKIQKKYEERLANKKYRKHPNPTQNNVFFKPKPLTVEQLQAKHDQRKAMRESRGLLNQNLIKAAYLPDVKDKKGYDKFVKHVNQWKKLGIPYGLNDLRELAKKYNTPIPLNVLKKMKI